MESYRFSNISSDIKNDEIKRLDIQAKLFVDKDIRLLSAAGLNSATRIADLGCGPGFVAALLAKEFPETFITGIDISEDLIAFAKDRHKEIANLTFETASAYDTKLADNYFDLIYSRLVFQHLSDPLRAAKEAYRLCKPGGSFGIIDIDASLQKFHPSLPATEAVMRRINEKQKSDGGDREIGSKLPSILKAAGFEDVSVRLESISTLNVSLKDYFEISAGYADWLIDEEEGRKSLDESRREIENSTNVFALFPVFFIYGKKP